MEFYRDRKDTNIDSEFDNNRGFKSFKWIIIVVSIILLLGIVMVILLNSNKGSNKKNINYLELTGDSEIVLYQGDDYVELGYKAYNSNDEDLSDKVDVSSNLNINEVGEYEIRYVLGDIKKIRKIRVIEKPLEYTYIELKLWKDTTDVVLMVGEEYIEPGYDIVSTDKEFVPNVKITGEIDTTKVGEYTLIYSLIDPNGNEIYAVRNIKVIDIVFKYSLSELGYTDKDIEIRINVIADGFNYIVAPDSSKISNSSYTYIVSDNGTYLFKVYNVYGYSKEFNVNITNIDRKVPVGTCNVYHNKNGSIININAIDTSGISKYVYNGTEYLNNKIVLNYYLKDNVEVSFYDGVGYMGNASCVVEEIPKEYLIDTSHYSYNNGIKTADVTSVDVTDLSCTIVNGYFYPVKKITVHKTIADNFHGILGLVCDYVNDTPWMEYLQHDGAFVNREIRPHDYHSKGVAIDLNDLWTYTHNGKTYKPYSWQGISVWEDYNEFICEVCDGEEDCPYNINYIIYKRFFEGNGWCWGGNYSPEYFDPMHFELRDYGTCADKLKGKISC